MRRSAKEFREMRRADGVQLFHGNDRMRDAAKLRAGAK